MKKTILILSIITLIFAGCKKFDEIEASKVKIIDENIEKGWDYIKISAQYNYPVELETVKIYLSEKEDMSGAESYDCNVEGKTFSVEVNGLKERTIYYYCYEYDKGYDKEKCDVRGSFTTMYCGHDYVDLGLSVKWATCNVGAETPEEYGDYYAWGETTTKADYSLSNCPTYGLSISELKSQGYIDGEGNLTPQHDAATANWGGDWRMPTGAEQEELLNNCTWNWTTQNGVKGYKVTGPNGNSIFLPAAGYRDGSSLGLAGSRGSYWRSAPGKFYNDNYACSLYFNSSKPYMGNCYRYTGLSVRPVLSGDFEESEEPEKPKEPEQPETPGTNQTFNVNGVSFTMIAVKGGTFQMGATSEQGSDADNDEKPVHNVTLSDYYIGETEVTQELWQAVMGSNPSKFSGSQRPVESVSWNDCQKFITKLNNLTGKNFRLPTEAEWEYAARGGNKSKGYKYSGSNTIDDVAWYQSNSSSRTHDVKTKQVNELGIYDMSGNVYEWCQDWYGSYSSSSQINPTGPTSGSYRVIRGGSWNGSAERCRVSNRSINNPDY